MLELDVKQKVVQIAECLFDRIQKQEAESFGLYNGEFGILLFLLYYSKYTQNEQHFSMTQDYAEKLMQQFVEKEKQHTFCSGLSGILYLFEFLREHEIIDLDVSEIQQELDDYVVFHMRQDIQRAYYDFMHGALGVGLYFLKRKTNPEYIHEIIDYLHRTAEIDPEKQIYKWESVVEYIESPVYNLSLCHGISAIIIFLSRVVKSGVYNEKTQKMLTGAVNFILSQQNDFEKVGSFFPNFSLKNEQDTELKSRLAWCYGDLGIALALWQAGNATGQTEWEEKGLEILLQSTHRLSFQQTNVFDAGICHGSAGIAMIFRRMWVETNRDEFKDVIPYWIKQTLDYSRFDDGLAGYKTWMKDHWVNEYSLLTGISGIGLVLLSYIDKNQHDWDEMLFITTNV